MIGLKRGSVELLPHQEEWNKNAEDVISELRQLFGNAAIDISPYMKLLEEYGFVFRGEDVAGQSSAIRCL